MKGFRKEEQNRTTRLSNRSGHVKFFGEKHLIELLVGMGILTFSSMKSKQMKKQRQLSTSGGTKKYTTRKMQSPYTY